MLLLKLRNSGIEVGSDLHIGITDIRVISIAPMLRKFVLALIQESLDGSNTFRERRHDAPPFIFTIRLGKLANEPAPPDIVFIAMLGEDKINCCRGDP